MPDVLAVEDLRVRYGRHTALDGVSLSVRRGEVLGLIGETGSGKTTLARAALGLVRPAGGRILVDGEEVSGPRGWRALRRRGLLQYVFQDPLRSLDPDLTVAESLLEPLLVRGVPRSAALERVRTRLAEVRLDPDLLGRLPGELSGGQRQRVAVARAIVAEPALVVLDEPVSALDAANRVQVLEILKGLRDSGVALVLVSHDLGSVAGVADRIAVLHQGSLVELGETRAVLTDPRHPYTRLLVGSAPTLRRASAGRTERDALRDLLNA